MMTLITTTQSQGSERIAARACLSDSSWRAGSTAALRGAMTTNLMATNLMANPARIETTAVHFATKGMTKPYRQRPKETLR